MNSNHSDILLSNLDNYGRETTFFFVLRVFYPDYSENCFRSRLPLASVDSCLRLPWYWTKHNRIEYNQANWFWGHPRTPWRKVERVTQFQLYVIKAQTPSRTHSYSFQEIRYEVFKFYSEHSKPMRIWGESINIIDMIEQWIHFFINSRGTGGRGSNFIQLADVGVLKDFSGKISILDILRFKHIITSAQGDFYGQKLKQSYAVWGETTVCFLRWQFHTIFP